MTCIVAIESPDGVWIGSDSFVGDDQCRDLVDRPKVWRSGGLALGMAGSIRACQIAEQLSAPPKRRKRESDLDYILRAVVEPMRAAHDKAGLETSELFYAIIACDGRAYVVYSDYGVHRSNHGYAAIGAGEFFALGALAATPKLSPERRVRQALKAAARHCTGVCAPFYVDVVS